MSPHKTKMCLFVDVHSTWLAQTVWQTTDGNCNPARLPAYTCTSGTRTSAHYLFIFTCRGDRTTRCLIALTVIKLKGFFLKKRTCNIGYSLRTKYHILNPDPPDLQILIRFVLVEYY